MDDLYPYRYNVTDTVKLKQLLRIVVDFVAITLLFFGWLYGIKISVKWH